MNKKTYNVKLEVKSPLFIGNGVKYSRINYINDFSNKRIYILDEIKWIEFLTKKMATDLFINYVQKKGKFTDIIQFLKENNRLFRIENFEKIYPSISSHYLSTSHLDKMNNNEIESFIKGYFGLPYIPGSSIKGAISNAILKRSLENNYEDSEKIAQYIEQYSKTKRLERNVKSILESKLDFQKNINGKTTPYKGMAGIQISDSTTFPLENLKIYKKVDIAPRNPEEIDMMEKGDLPLFRECAEIGTTVEFKIGIDFMKINPNYGINSIDDLMEIINQSFESIYGEKGVISEYKLINQFLPESRKGLVFMQLGGGAGFHSKTALSGLALRARDRNILTSKILSVKFRNHKHEKGVKVISPRCLKVVNVGKKKILMGICEISKIRENKNDKET